jgi:NADH-quinone oxidoreductase subunit J
VAVLILCIVAGVGTVLLLPGRREASVRKIGGAILLATMLVLAAILARQGAMGAGSDIYFWLFSAIAIASAVRVISHTRPVYSALYFVLAVLAVAGLFILLWAEFMAAALVLIYAGAILITYVFVIMLASQVQAGGASTQPTTAEYDQISREPFFAAVVGFALMGLLLFVIFDKAQAVFPAHEMTGTGWKTAEAESATMHTLGRYLFNEHLVTLELAGLLLTLSMVGAVVIARRRVEPEAGAAAREAPAIPGGADDDPHNIPVTGTLNPQAKAYPES